ncbi:M42 family metallopeptidase [Lentilactobacillus diolivorans]|uniref:Aminopeptidase I zinc metalloprotease n=2 Tax=Lentilactobacillus diolivorans TaxID=179838 RepID=A0A0R1SNT7_9LACO|nr:M20/M25/M40 family metallo-hydrolase [Lentilactobacillus diolivorans]KRL67768.1 aminopeptidase I zinc metalloprotease [Lentilactobacillus diolivorans DSM 14421]GEP22960.1 aminopeptidase [Lentilactobacillus diolivorans]
MDKTQRLQLIETLSNANGAPGYEDEVTNLALKWGGHFANAKRDPMGNVYLSHRGNDDKKPTLMVDAHLDAVGFVVQAVDDNGMIKFVPNGGWVPSNVAAQKMRVRDKNGDYIPALVVSKPPHFMMAAEKKQPISIDHMRLDVGSTSREETLNDFGIQTGAPIVPDTTWSYNPKHDFMMGKAFDNRMGTAAAITSLAELADTELPVNLVVALSTQEEIGCRGARVTSRNVHPDIGICLEGCPADDTFTPAWLSQTKFRGGPMLRDQDTSFIASHDFQAFVAQTADELKMPYTRAVRTGGGVDASEMLLETGAPTVCIGIPVRYEHTNYALCAYPDFEKTVQLVTNLIPKLTVDQLKKWYVAVSK